MVLRAFVEQLVSVGMGLFILFVQYVPVDVGYLQGSVGREFAAVCHLYGFFIAVVEFIHTFLLEQYQAFLYHCMGNGAFCFGTLQGFFAIVQCGGVVFPGGAVISGKVRV